MQIQNNITLVGNVGTDVQVTNFDNGGKIARFKLATSSYKDQKKREWHRIFAWGSMAQFIEAHGSKGKPLAIHGKLVNRTYTSKEGQQRKYTEIEVRHIIGM